MKSFSKHPFIVNVVGPDLKIKQQIVWINTDDKQTVNAWKNRDAAKLKKMYPKHSMSGGADDEIEIEDELEIDVGEINLDDEPVETPQMVDLDKKSYICVEDIYIFPEDNVSTFKHKIHVATNIPAYRQHVWCEYKKVAMPLRYSITLDTVAAIDIRTLPQYTHVYEGIPIDVSWYEAKDSIKVTALDDTTLLGSLHDTYGITEFYLMDLGDFINPIRSILDNLLTSDKYTIEMIYYSFVMKYWPYITITIFGDYIKHEGRLYDQYPLLAPKVSMLQKRYIAETAILSTKVPNVDFIVSITHSVLTISRPYVSTGFTIHLRSLFDLFAMDETIKYIVCHTEIDTRPIILNKTYRRSKAPGPGPLNSIKFGIEIESGELVVVISKSGGYTITSNWNEETHMNFRMIYDTVESKLKPLIAKINAIGSRASTHPLSYMNYDNTVFSGINVCMIWKKTISAQRFLVFKGIIDKYTAAGIIQKSSVTNVNTGFYITKGMFKYDMQKYLQGTPNNQYSYLSSEAQQLRYETVLKTKRMNVVHRFSDVKVDIEGIKEQEYTTVHSYISRMIAEMPSTNSAAASTSTDKKLKMLKEMDPVLYDFKRYDDHDTVYSKLCQKQKQPLIHTEPGKGRIEYWNFTTNVPAYYSCPNPMYPYVNFIVHAHPAGYCIPCCYKIKPVEDSKDKKSEIYRACIKTRVYAKHRGMKTKSRYVMAYGRHIDPGRLSKLPSASMEPLFYDTFSAISGIDFECESTHTFYVFGTAQHLANVSNVGVLFTVSHALKMDIMTFVTQSIIKMADRQSGWHTLLDGEIIYYYESFEVFANALRAVFIGSTMSDATWWNRLFIDIATVYWNINIVHFIDTAIGDDQSQIHLMMNSRIRHESDYVSDNKHLVVIERDRMFYPVYKLNAEVYFKTGSIVQRLFDKADSMISTVHQVYNHTLEKNYTDELDLQFIMSFAQNEYKIKTLYINSANQCYAVVINDVFIPIYPSIYYPNGISISFDAPTSVGSWQDLSAIKDAMNEYIKSDTENSYAAIVIDHWLLLRDTVIGFQNAGMYYMCKPFDKPTAQKIQATTYIKLRYDPMVVNAAIAKNMAPKSDNRKTLIQTSLYKRYLYHILMLELIGLVNNYRNVDIRKKITNIINSEKDSPAMLFDIREILKEYPRDYVAVRNLYLRQIPTTLGVQEDSIANAFNNSVFDFDQKLGHDLQKMPIDQLVAKLTDIFSELTVDATPSFTGEFPNVITTCTDGEQEYCRNKKLMISKPQLTEYIKIMAADISNPAKSMYVFNPIFVKNTFNYFQFILRKDEHISITI